MQTLFPKANTIAAVLGTVEARWSLNRLPRGLLSRFAVLAVLCFGVSLLPLDQVKGQPPESHFVTTTAIVEAPAKQVWRYVRDFGNLAEIVAPGLRSSEREGRLREATWVLTLPNGATIDERTTAYSNRDRLLRYIMTDTPMPLENYVGTVLVTPLADGTCRLTLESSYAATPEAAEKLQAQFKGFQQAFLKGTAAHFPAS